MAAHMVSLGTQLKWMPLAVGGVAAVYNHLIPGSMAYREVNPCSTKKQRELTHALNFSIPIMRTHVSILVWTENSCDSDTTNPPSCIKILQLLSSEMSLSCALLLEGKISRGEVCAPVTMLPIHYEELR
jgi:hypothetical protein